MLSLLLVLLAQDPQWGAAVARAAADLDLPLRQDLTGAERDTCAQAYDRIGYWAAQRPALETRAQELQAMRDQASATEVSTTAEGDWKSASVRVADALIAEVQTSLIDGNRTAHALQGEVLVFCNAE